MFAEGFAMIGGEEKQGVIVKAGGPKLVEEAAHVEIAKGDLAVIAGDVSAFVGRAHALIFGDQGPVDGVIRFGRIVRAVRVDEVDPDEERLRGSFLEPLNGLVDGLIGPALKDFAVLFPLGHEVVVDVKALAEVGKLVDP
jgi:hypothetical protein